MIICLAKEAEGMRSRTWLSYFIYHVMTEHTKNGGEWKETFKLTGEHGTEADVRVTVNGVEIPFESFIQHLEKYHDDMVGEAAKKLIEEKFGDLIGTLEKMSENAKLKLEHDVLPSWEKERNGS